ncbi:MAG: hypothetical protein ACE5OQ_02990 [Woeseia sp.]
MAMDATATSLDPALSAQSIVKSVKSNLKVPAGFASEHILIGGDETDTPDEPAAVGKRMILANRARGIETELTFFDEGFLKVRECRRKKLTKDYLLELRFLNPTPTTIKRIVLPSLWTAMCCGGAAAVSWLTGVFTSLDAYTFPASIALATVALVAILLFTYQSGEKVLFFTASGNVPVLMLLSSFGCFRRCRRIVPKISHAIGVAGRKNSVDEEAYLRAEMQDHYRLKNDGIITPRACSTATGRILARFS